MKYTVCLSFFFSFLVSSACAQSHLQDSILAHEYLSKTERLYTANRDSFRLCLEKAIPLLQKIGDWEMSIACHNSLSNYYYQEDDYQMFEKYALMAIQESEEKLKTPGNSSAVALNNMSFYYKLLGNYDQAILMYKKAYEIQKSTSPSAAAFIRLHQNTSVVYRQKGDYDQAMSYLNQALQVHKDSIAEDNISLAKTYLDMAHLYRDKSLLKKAKSHYLKSLKILELLDSKKNPSVIDYNIFANQSLSKVYLQEGNIDKSYAQIQKAISLQDDRYQSRRISSYKILGDIFMQKKDFPSALKAYETSNELAFESYATYNKKDTKARTLKDLAKAYLAKNDLDNAFQYYQSALIALSVGFEETSPDENPDIDQMISKLEGLEIITGKAKSFFEKYKVGKEVKDLETAFKNFDFSTKIIQELRNSFLAKGSKNILSEQSLDIYEGGIQSAILLYKQTNESRYLEKAFHFAEQNKARLLEETLQENHARLAGGLPQKDIEKEQQLKLDITFYEKKINREKSKSSNINQARIEIWNTTLFDLKNKYNELINRFEKEYADYHALKYAIKKTDVEDIRTKILNGKNMFLEYFVGTDNIYLFSITKNDLNVFEIPKNQSFETDISTLRTIISQPPLVANQFKIDRDKFVKLSHLLYKIYLEPALRTLPKNINHLIIVPDDVLTYLPFELLLTKAAKEGTNDYSTNSCAYLNEQFAISYNYSASLLTKHSAWEAQPDLSPFLGFAPTFGNEIASSSRACTGDNVYTLQCNGEEVSTINEILNGQTIEGPAANIQSFQEQAQQCRILHLATHACIDEEDPELNKIYFADNYLTGTDLNGLKLNAELAVLSACNTGSGKLIKGEGVMSLSRGFILSGCPSTLTSLWSVDDCTTSSIMLQYYKNLKDGLSKDAALQKAKQEHLSTADKVFSHPYYWAAFVQSGNTEVMSFSNAYAKYLYLLLLPLFLIVVFYFKK